MARIEEQPALVLHTRPYRETSLLVDLLTARYGRVPALLKGGKPRLQVFSTFLATWYGKDLVTLAAPKDVQARWLTGLGASAGLYLNELLVRSLREREPVPEVFAMACWAVAELDDADGGKVRAVLRSVERRLLQTLGYGIDYRRVRVSDAPVEADGCYLLEDNSGFVPATPASQLEAEQLARRGYVETAQGLLLRGALIAQVDAEAYEHAGVAAAARRIYGRCLAPLLGDRPLKSRELLTGAQP